MKMKRFLLALTLLMLFQSITVFASEGGQKQNELTYTVYNKDGSIAEEGIIPDPDSRASWGGVTLQNAQSVIFGGEGLYCYAGTAVDVNVTLNKVAKIDYRLLNSNGITVASTANKAQSMGFTYTTTVTDRYRGQVTNVSSDPVLIQTFSITF